MKRVLFIVIPNLQMKSFKLGTSLVVQWLGVQAYTAGGSSLIPGQGTKIPHAAWRGQIKRRTLKKKKKKKRNFKLEKFK